ncbi:MULTISPECIES: excisionase [Cronobacter]|uniref:excisionase n=2 Tax=Cronobacter TaxID=413496 RepID=UPI0030DBEB00
MNEVNMALITLKEWNARQPRPRCMEVVRRWARAGRIQPPPYMDGREYLVEETAVKINPLLKTSPQAPSDTNLRERIKNGGTTKKRQNTRTPS